MNYLDRLEKEYKDICAKKGALAHFIEYGNHDNLNEAEEGLLSVQYSTMEAYSNDTCSGNNVSNRETRICAWI